MERLTSDRLFSVDMVVELAGHHVAVEANGPCHYTVTKPRRLLGNKVLRDWFLENRGYVVLNVPWWTWIEVNTSPESARQYLRQQLCALLGDEVRAELNARGRKA